MDGLERALAKGNVALDCVEVYDTMPHPNIEKNVLDALAEEVPEYVVYFSPSGINSSLPFFKQTDVDLNQIKVTVFSSNSVNVWDVFSHGQMFVDVTIFISCSLFGADTVFFPTENVQLLLTTLSTSYSTIVSSG